MLGTTIEGEALIRASIFFSVLCAMLVLERLIPRRVAHSLGKPQVLRQLTNIGLTFLNTLTLKALPALSAVFAAHLAASLDWGLHTYLEHAPILTIACTVILLDLAIYFQHRAFHRWPIFWRFHQVHHCDVTLDTTTALRFHPLEILLSMAYKICIVLAIGAPVIAVIVFEILLNAGALFNHANIRIPGRLEPLLRLFIVTPDMHAIHHSTKKCETDSNYGFFFSIWDRIFHSYTDHAALGHDVKIGLEQYSFNKTNSIPKLLILPFKRNNQT